MSKTTLVTLDNGAEFYKTVYENGEVVIVSKSIVEFFDGGIQAKGMEEARETHRMLFLDLTENKMSDVPYQKPTKGRQVVFVENGQEHTGTVTFVQEDGTVNLYVLRDNGNGAMGGAIKGISRISEVLAGEWGWKWPERV